MHVRRRQLGQPEDLAFAYGIPSASFAKRIARAQLIVHTSEGSCSSSWASWGRVAVGSMHRHPDRACCVPFGGPRATDPSECQAYLSVEKCADPAGHLDRTAF